MLSIVVAKAKNNIIGKNNKMLWNLPADLKRFKELTMGHTIIMGRKTFESIGKVLPNRKHVILSQNPDFKVDDENVKIVNSVNELKEYINSDEENFVIGGAMIYNLLMHYVTKLYVTQIEKDFEGDAFFPKIDSNKWKVIAKEQGIKDSDNNLDYEYIVYERVD